MKIGFPKPTIDGEHRIALIPETCAKLKKAGLDILVEADAGSAAGFSDASFQQAGAAIVQGFSALCIEADAIVLVHPPTADDIAAFRADTILICPLNALSDHAVVQLLAERGVTSLALELMPRITRAQKMDVLSAMSTIAGYKAVLLAAGWLNKIFPMMMTAAGTLAPARVLVLGAGVAGLQAIATAKRLGAVVEAFDVRPAVKEQVESLGARFVVVDAPPENAEDKAGYAKESSAAYKLKQQEAIAKHVRENDVAISTALIPGKRAPILITAEMVRSMKPGSVIVDLASEAGGNCELTRPGETIIESGVTIIAPRNLPASVPFHASQMFARNVAAVLLEFWKNNELQLDTADEIVAAILVTRGGEIVHPRVRELINLPRPTAAVS